MIPISTKKACDTSQYLFNIQGGHSINYDHNGIPQENKGQIWTPTASIILNGKMLSDFPFKVKNNTIPATQLCSTLYQNNSMKKLIIKVIWPGKQDVKDPVSGDDIILSTQNARASIKPLELINQPKS